jgi:hypothetical protein
MGLVIWNYLDVISILLHYVTAIICIEILQIPRRGM